LRIFTNISAFQEMGNSEVLEQLATQLLEDAMHPPHESRGVPQEFLDSLDRIPRKKLKSDDTCAICNTAYLEGSWISLTQRDHELTAWCRQVSVGSQATV
jgi:hypothetical protein